MSGASYRIGMLARLTGVSTHALRVWERRYQAFAPARAPKGARLYSDADVERVRLLKRLIEEGHSIGDLAHLDVRSLEELAKRSAAPERDRANATQGMGQLAKNLVVAATSFEPERAAETLHRALVSLAPRDVVLGVVAPALDEIGKSQDGLCILGEHAVSAIIRTELGRFVSAGARNPGPLIVCTTPQGELHELGTLLVASMITAQGYRPLYLGPNLPAPQIAEAARRSRARAVALSVVALDPVAAHREISAVVDALPPRIDLLLGGRQARLIERLPARATVFEDLWAFGAWLERSMPARDQASPNRF
jgi:MerR family transcriptional regulator, light-induced transcriptional regulator